MERSMSFTLFTILLVGLLQIPASDGGQTCASCKGVEGGLDCQTFHTCEDNEMCHMTAYRNDVGQNLYDYACAYPQACHHSVDSILVGRSIGSSASHILCSVCCNHTNLCNKDLSCDTSGTTPASVPEECADLASSTSKNGTYTIYPYDTPQVPVRARCEFDSHGNGWTVIQRRFNGFVNFYRGWTEYKAGFGSPDGEYWIGNDVIHELTSNAHHILRVVMSDFDGVTKFAQYSAFDVGKEINQYQMFVAGYSGTAGDSLTQHSGQRFTTFDTDNDRSGANCAVTYHGAWWYDHCHASNLNGRYLAGHHDSYADGINWGAWHGEHYSLKTVEMMIRRL